MLLSPALAHPDVNNGPSVTQLFALESCAPLHSPQSHPLFLQSLRLQCSSLCPSFSPFSTVLMFFSFISLPLHALFPFFFVQFSNCVLFAALSIASLFFPWDQFTCAWPNRFPPYASVMESSASPPLSSAQSFTSPSSLALSLPPLLLTFRLPTHFKFN